MIKAIAFDADNTLYKTRGVAKKANITALKFLAKQGIPQQQLLRQLERIIDKVKNSRNPKVRFWNYAYKQLAKKYKLKHCNKAYKMFLYEVLKNIKPEPQIKNVLEQLRKNCKFAVFTEDPGWHTIDKLKKTGLKKYFKIVISSDDTEIMKPSSKYYKLLQKKLKLKPSEILIVGDYYAKDIAPAKKLGFTTVLYKDKNRADYCVRNHKQLPKIVKNIK